MGTTVSKGVNGTYIQHSVGMFWVHGHTGVSGNEFADGLAREATAHQFVGPEPALRVCRIEER
jgi:Ribonuclease HI